MTLFYVLAVIIAIISGIFRAMEAREPRRAGRRWPIALLCLAGCSSATVGESVGSGGSSSTMAECGADCEIEGKVCVVADGGLVCVVPDGGGACAPHPEFFSCTQGVYQDCDPGDGVTGCCTSGAVLVSACSRLAGMLTRDPSICPDSCNSGECAVSLKGTVTCCAAPGSGGTNPCDTFVP